MVWTAAVVMTVFMIGMLTGMGIGRVMAENESNDRSACSMKNTLLEVQRNIVEGEATCLSVVLTKERCECEQHPSVNIRGYGEDG